MTQKELENLIKLKKDRLTLAQLYRNEFIKELGGKGYEDFINSELEGLKLLLEQHKKINNAKDKD